MVLTFSGLMVVITVLWHSLDHDTLDDTLNFFAVLSFNEMLISASLTLAVYKSWRKYWRDGVRNPRKYLGGGKGGVGSQSNSSLGSTTSSKLVVQRPAGLVLARPPAGTGHDKRQSGVGMVSLAGSSTDSVASMTAAPSFDGGSY